MKSLRTNGQRGAGPEAGLGPGGGRGLARGESPRCLTRRRAASYF